MSVVGSSAAQSIAQAAAVQPGKPAAERVKPADGKVRRRAEDQYESVTPETDGADAVRSAKGNGQEESHEDRQEHPAYTPDGKAKKSAPPRLDLNA